MTELVTFGETMLRLSPPQGQRLSRVSRLDVHVGGAESNVAVAASSLGIDTAWLSALPETELGERIAYALRGEAVELLVDWTETGRVGTYYFEPGGRPRGGAVVYDRVGTPVREVTPEDLPVGRIESAEIFFTSGITPALSEQLEETTEQLLATATDAGVTTAFDVNYRATLWRADAARETLRALFPAVDVLFIAERDARNVLDCGGDPSGIARELVDQYGFETLVLTRSEEGAIALQENSDTLHEQAAFETDTVDAVGSGDAFVGGFLAQRLDGGSVPDALAYGAATAALKRTIEGDMALVSPAEVQAVIEENRGISR